MVRKNEIEQIKQEIEEYVREDNGVYKEDKETSTILIYFSKDMLADSYGGKAVLGEDIFHYVENTFKLVNKKKKIELEFIFGEEIEPKEQEEVIKLFKMHYAIEIVQCRKQLVKTRIVSGILLLVGILFLIVYGVVAYGNKDFIFENVLEIVSWVFIWEAANQFFFENASNKRDMIRNICLFRAEIKKGKQ